MVVILKFRKLVCKRHNWERNKYLTKLNFNKYKINRTLMKLTIYKLPIGKKNMVLLKDI